MCKENVKVDTFVPLKSISIDNYVYVPVDEQKNCYDNYQ